MGSKRKAGYRSLDCRLKQKNLKTFRLNSFRLFLITGTKQIYVPVEIQKMLKGAGKIRVQILGA
jgi:hypothetical protein